MTDTQYEWISTGGCERCDSMATRTYSSPPARPHPNCTCLVRVTQEERCEDREAIISFEHTGSFHDSADPDPDDTFRMTFDYRIECPTGLVLTGEIEITRTYRDMGSMDFEDWVDDVLEEVQLEVEIIAADQCPPCPGNVA